MRKFKRKKTRKKKTSGRVYLVIAFLIIVLGLIFISQQTKKITEEIKQTQKINLSQYKEATFSDSFSSEAWINIEQTTMVFDKEKMLFVYPEDEMLVGSLSEAQEIKKQLEQIVSKKVNFNVKNIIAAVITRIEDYRAQAQIKYFLSNNTGEDWYESGIAGIVCFKNLGGDLVWKAEVTSTLESVLENEAAQNTPYISSINLKYWYAR